MIDAANVLEPLGALREGKDIDARKLKFNYFESEQKGDFPSLDLLVPVLSQKAWSALRDLISRFCRSYDLKIEGQDYIALSVHHIVDCLDKDTSKLEYFKVPALKHRIVAVHEIALVDAKIDGATDLSDPGHRGEGGLSFRRVHGCRRCAQAERLGTREGLAARIPQEEARSQLTFCRGRRTFDVGVAPQAVLEGGGRD